MATNSKNTGATGGIAIHPDLVGGGVDAAGIQAFLGERQRQGVPCQIMAVMTQSESDAAMARLDELGAFRPLAEGGYGFARNKSFFPRSEAVLARHLKAAGFDRYIAGNDHFSHHPQFPEGVLGLNLGAQASASPTARNWAGIEELMDIPLFREQRFRKLTPLRSLGTAVYRIRTEQRSVLLKVYPAGADQAAEAEQRAAMAAAELPTLEQLWQGNGLALFADPGGECAQTPTRTDLQALSRYLDELERKAPQLRGLGPSRDARLSLETYAAAVTQMWGGIFNAAQGGHKQIMLFMMTDLEQLRQDCINHYYLWCKRQKWEKDKALPENERLYAPGALRFHNLLRVGERLYVLDNANAGWDDPVHLISDIFFDHHQVLTLRAKMGVLDSFRKQRAWDGAFMDRLWAVADLVAVEWILRLLAVILPSERERLCSTMSSEEYLGLVAGNLEQARQLREHFTAMEHLCKHDQLLDNDAEIN